MFKVGDKVVYKPTMVQGVIFDVIGFDDFGWVQVEGKLEGLDMPKRYSEEPPFQDIRLATPQEIAAGHRIDCEILDHPEDYTSPNCKKINLEQVK